MIFFLAICKHNISFNCINFYRLLISPKYSSITMDENNQEVEKKVSSGLQWNLS